MSSFSGGDFLKLDNKMTAQEKNKGHIIWLMIKKDTQVQLFKYTLPIPIK